MTDPFFWLDNHNAIIGTSDAGKTWTAKWAVEEMLRQKRHTVIIDPLGVWYGLRSSADGTGPGFDIPIFGGRHGDVPIGAGDGTAIARIIVDQRVSAIVDLSDLHSGPEQRLFVRDLVAQLRRRSDRANLHFVVDEADEFVPEKTRDDVAFALQEDMLWIAKKGRSSGWVQTLITQRTADIAKSSLSMSQTIIAHQLVSPQDQKPFLDWIKSKGSKAELTQVEHSLAGLQRGERYFYSPRAGVFTRGMTPAIATFDSSRTPPPGQSRVEPRMLAQLDVSALRAALAVEDERGFRQAIAELDPDAIVRRDHRIAELEERIALLEHQLAESSRARKAAELALAAVYDLATSIVTKAGLFLVQRTHEGPSAREGGEVMPPVSSTSEAGRAARSGSGRGAGPATKDAPAPGEPAGAGASASSEKKSAPSKDNSAAALRRGRRALLQLASVHPAGLTEAQWATMSALSRRGGTWSTYKGALRTAGLIEQNGELWFATDAGLSAMGAARFPYPDVGPDRARFWGNRIPGVMRMVDVLIKRSPHFTTREALAADLGMSAAGGTFGTYLGRLRANGLLDEQGKRLRLHPSIIGKD